MHLTDGLVHASQAKARMQHLIVLDRRPAQLREHGWCNAGVTCSITAGATIASTCLHCDPGTYSGFTGDCRGQIQYLYFRISDLFL